MSRSQAVRSGFGAVFRKPAVFLAELAWRWAFGAATLLLLAYSVLLFTSSTSISDRDLFGLSGLIPGTMRSALVHIFSGSGPVLVRLLLAVGGGIGLLWWLASSLGRAVVLQELLPISKLSSAAALRSLFKFNLLRALISFCAVLAYIASFVIAWRFASGGQAATGDLTPPTVDANVTQFYVVFVPLALLIGWLWSTLSWYLTLAPIIAVSSGRGLLDSISHSAAIAFSRFRQFSWVGFVFGTLRFLLAAIVFTFVVTVFGVLVQVSTPLAVAVSFLFLLVYFAVSDFLAVVRLAAYVRIIDWDPETAAKKSALKVEPPSATSFESPAVDPI